MGGARVMEGGQLPVYFLAIPLAIVTLGIGYIIWGLIVWGNSETPARTAIAACGAAKYSWFVPAIAGRAARDHIGRSSYGQDTSAAAAARRVTPLVTLIANWADAAQA